ncbi:phosphoglycerate kinase [Candidatus Pacearchaeota archaeon]|nr:phosphoglycerate kinase [Candidatus Pacearchaeota archaeon]
MKTLNDFDFLGKTVLLRSDLNSDVVNGRVLLSMRIKESVKTIKELKKKGAKVIILAHQGRKGKDDYVSLEQHVKYLCKYTKVKFVKDIIGDRAREEIGKMKNGEAILLENVRFLEEEFKPGKNDLVKFFMGIVDIYVNDAFSVCHRRQTSIVSFPKYFPSCMGRILEREVNALKKIQVKNCLYILGGAKPEENIILLGKNKVLACGLFGQLCLISKGKNLGAQNDYLKSELYLAKKLRKRLKNVTLPKDFAVLKDAKRYELDLSEFPSKYEIFDIGEKTIALFENEIKKAKAIYMKGPAGFCAEKKFCKGTFAILRAIAKSSAFSLIGGGHLSDAMEASKISRQGFSHISLSGGALLRFIAGERLPGLDALR